MPNFEKPFLLETDACDYGYGAVLAQEIDGNNRPIAFYSKNYTKAQKNYPTSEKELLAIVMAVEYFHQYLYGRHFKVFTDHLPLTWLLHKKDPHPRLDRWLMRLSIYQLEIIYKPGKDNVIADLLSRMPDENEVEDPAKDYDDIVIAAVEFDDNKSIVSEDNLEIWDEIDRKVPADTYLNIQVIAMEPNSNNLDEYFCYKTEQSKDEDLNWIKSIIRTYKDEKPIMNKFKNETRRTLFNHYDELRIVEDILYREAEDINGYAVTQYVLPAHIVVEVIEKVHASVYNGHLGRKKTTEKMIARFYRPGLRSYIKEYVRRCDVCQKIKYTRPQVDGELIYLKPSRPNEIITTDLTADLVETSDGNRYIMVVIDHFTKFAQFFALKDTKSETIADILVEGWCNIFGIPEAILSDGGKQYDSKLVEQVYELFDIRKLKTTAYHPQCDGLSERMVQTVKNMTKAHVNAEQTNWDRNLKKLAYAYNTAVNDTIKQTPFEMMFLRKPKIPIDLLIPPINERGRERIDKPETIEIDREQVEILEDVEVELSMPEKAREYLKELNEKMTNCFQIATNQRNLVMDKAKINHDRSIKKMEYKVGDLVLVDHPRIGKGLSHGLAKKYRGPYVIVGKNKNKVDYLIREVGKPKSKMKQLHKSHLKAYFDMGRPSKWLKTREDSKVNKQTQTRTKEFPEINEDSIDRNKKPNQMKKKGPLKLKEPVQKRKPVKSKAKKSCSSISKSIESVKTKRKYIKNPANPRWKHQATGNKQLNQIDQLTDNDRVVRRSSRLKNKNKN